MTNVWGGEMMEMEDEHIGKKKTFLLLQNPFLMTLNSFTSSGLSDII